MRVPTTRSYPADLLGPFVRQCTQCQRLILSGYPFSEVIKAKLANYKDIKPKYFILTIALHIGHSTFNHCYVCFHNDLLKDRDISGRGRKRLKHQIGLVEALYDSPEYLAAADQEAEQLDRRLEGRQLPIAPFAERSA